MTNTEPAAHTTSVDSDPPPTPDGYDDPYLLDYSRGILLLLFVLIGSLSFVWFGWILWAIHGPEVFMSVIDIIETEQAILLDVDFIGAGIPILVALVILVIVHELTHGTVMRYYEREVTYGVNPAMGAFYTAAFEQFQKVEERLPILIAPLLVITLVGTPLLFVPVSSVVLTVYLVLVFNAIGAVGDLYVSWHLWRMPEGTLVYDADLRRCYVFEPLETRTSRLSRGS